MTNKFRVGVTSDAKTSSGTQFGPEPLKLLEHPVIDWEFIPGSADGLTPDHAARYDALCVLGGTVDETMLSGNDTKVSIVARFGVGYDSVDVKACSDKGIIVTNTPNAVRRPVASSVITHMLAMSHRLILKDRLVRESRWREKGDFLGFGLKSRTLGVVGVGSIGKEILRLAHPFGPKLLGTDPYVAQNQVEDLNVEMKDLDTLLSEADIISINCFLSPETKGLIGSREFELMKKDSFFINTARGPIVDESALIDALRKGRIAGAAIDVFEKEPVEDNNPLLSMPNVVLSPHGICHTDECMRDIGAEAIQSVVDVVNDVKPINVVNPRVLNHKRWKDSFKNK